MLSRSTRGLGARTQNGLLDVERSMGKVVISDTIECREMMVMMMLMVMMMYAAQMDKGLESENSNSLLMIPTMVDTLPDGWVTRFCSLCAYGSLLGTINQPYT